jgi:hypothetical protein
MYGGYDQISEAGADIPNPTNVLSNLCDEVAWFPVRLPLPGPVGYLLQLDMGKQL